MQEFMLFIKTEGDHLEGMTPEQQQSHVKKVGDYIGGLMQEGKLKGAQPLEIDGVLLHGNKGVFKDGPFNESKELIVGYFHILAESLAEAVRIAKANPIFQEEGNTSMEIRPIKTVEGIN
jgi:hypothetical protein